MEILLSDDCGLVKFRKIISLRHKAFIVVIPNHKGSREEIVHKFDHFMQNNEFRVVVHAHWDIQVGRLFKLFSD